MGSDETEGMWSIDVARRDAEAMATEAGEWWKDEHRMMRPLSLNGCTDVARLRAAFGRTIERWQHETPSLVIVWPGEAGYTEATNATIERAAVDGVDMQWHDEARGIVSVPTGRGAGERCPVMLVHGYIPAPTWMRAQVAT